MNAFFERAKVAEIATILVLVAQASACAFVPATQEDVESDAPYDDAVAVTGAELTNASSTTSYPWALKVPGCTAIALTDRVLITARHCVEDRADGWQNGYTIRETTAAGIADLFTGRVYIEKFPSTDIPNDIAIVVTSSSLGRGFRTRIYNGAYPLWTGTFQGVHLPPAYDPFTILGYGRGSTGDSCAANGSTLKWRGTARFLGSDAVPRAPTPARTIYGTPDPSMVCPGDSGGPAFVRKNGWDLVFGTLHGHQDSTIKETLISAKWSWVTGAVARSGVAMACDQLGQDYKQLQGRVQVVTDSDKHLRCHH